MLTADSAYMSRTEKEKMLAGEPYLASDPELVAARTRARSLLRAFSQTGPEELDKRRSLLSQLLGTVSPDIFIEPPFFCDYGSNIHLGARVYMNFQCTILDCNRVEIGDDVMFGPGVHIYTATHPIDPDERTEGPEQALPVRIGNQVWIGGSSVICPGVTIGEGTTIGAGSVVTKDIPPRVLAVGNPCRVMRTLR